MAGYECWQCGSVNAVDNEGQIKSLESVCRELGEALEEAVKIEKYLIPDNGCPHAPDSPCDNLCAEEAEYEKAILRHKESLAKAGAVLKGDYSGRF